MVELQQERDLVRVLARARRRARRASRRRRCSRLRSRASRCSRGRSTAGSSRTTRRRSARCPGRPAGSTGSRCRRGGRGRTAAAGCAAPPAGDRSARRCGRRNRAREVQRRLRDALAHVLQQAVGFGAEQADDVGHGEVLRRSGDDAPARIIPPNGAGGGGLGHAQADPVAARTECRIIFAGATTPEDPQRWQRESRDRQRRILPPARTLHARAAARRRGRPPARRYGSFRCTRASRCMRSAHWRRASAAISSTASRTSLRRRRSSLTAAERS